MLTIHHLNNSRSQRVLWLLEELGLPYDIVAYRRQANLLAPPELRAVHPLGKSPILTEGDLTLAETGAIVTYILETHARGRLVPATGGQDYWTYQHFLHHAEGTAMPPLFLKLVLEKIPENAPMMVRPVLKAGMEKAAGIVTDPQIEALLTYWETAIERSGWFAGPEFSAADVMMSFPVEAASTRFSYADHPRLRDFLARIHGRPAYQAALAKGGPYAYAS